MRNIKKDKKQVSRQISCLWAWLKTHAPDWPGYALACAFVSVSAAVNVQVAYKTGGDVFVAWTMVVLALACQGFIALGPVYTLGRKRLWAGILAAPLWLVCVFFSANAALKYFDQNLADASARRATEQRSFATLQKQLAEKRDKRKLITVLRPADVIRSEIALILNKPGFYGKTIGERTSDCRKHVQRAPKYCKQVNGLRVELAQAAARDRLDKGIIKLSEQLTDRPAVGQARSEVFLSPVVHAASGLTGLDIRSADDLAALLLLLIAELGAALVPFLMSMCRQSQRPVQGDLDKADKKPSEAVSRSEQQAAVLSAKMSDPHFKKVSEWFGRHVVEVPGGQVPARQLYEDFCQFLGGEDAAKAQGFNVVKFGRLMTEGLGLNKGKAGKNWTVHYHDILLRAKGKAPFDLSKLSASELSKSVHSMMA